MYCTACSCEYNGWPGLCPRCKQPLRDGKPFEQKQYNGQLDYDSLVDLIKKSGAVLEISLSASEVSRKKSTRFPWLGFGYGWTQKMVGENDGMTVEFSTSEVGKDRKWSFPYGGQGYAWEQEMQGWIAGNGCTVRATKVIRKKSWGFPYAGYGFAWTEEMIGDCGEQIQVKFTASQVTRKRRRGFPYFGYGYAWVDEGTLAMKLIAASSPN